MKKLDGKSVADKILESVAFEVDTFKRDYGKVPALATVLVGNNPASKVYVSRKVKTCSQVGIDSRDMVFDEDIREDELLKKIDSLNVDKDVNGILVQLPLPPHINVEKVISKISPEKDVDGFHPLNLGKLIRGSDCLIPCTPHGVLSLLKEYSVPIEGKNCVIVGRSTIVGKPLAILLLQENATVTICHSRTSNLRDMTNMADILISAVGKPGFIKADFVKEGAVVVDVGINTVSSESEAYRIKGEKGVNSLKKRGYLLVGDVEYITVKEKASYITPVPGGVGPLTIAMLMKNTLKAFKNQLGG